MNSGLDLIWEHIIQCAKWEILTDKELYIRFDRKELFVEIYNKTVSQFKKQYMHSPEMYIDRHKMAACLIYSIIKTHVIEGPEKGKGVFLASNYYLAISIAFSFINAARENEIDITNIVIPRAFVLDTHIDYVDHLVKMLNICEIEDNLNLLQLSHMLYLLELLSIRNAE